MNTTLFLFAVLILVMYLMALWFLSVTCEHITALYQALRYEFRVISTKQTAIAEKVSK